MPRRCHGGTGGARQATGSEGQEKQSPSRRRVGSKTSTVSKAVTEAGLPCPREGAAARALCPSVGNCSGPAGSLGPERWPPIRCHNPDKMPRRVVSGTPRGNACLVCHGAGLGEPGHPGRHPAGQASRQHANRVLLKAWCRLRGEACQATRLTTTSAQGWRGAWGDPSPPKLAVPRPHRVLAPIYGPCTALASIRGGAITPWHLCPASTKDAASHPCVTNLPLSRSRWGHRTQAGKKQRPPR